MQGPEELLTELPVTKFEEVGVEKEEEEEEDEGGEGGEDMDAEAADTKLCNNRAAGERV